MTRSIGMVCWRCKDVYGVGGKLLKAVQSFYIYIACFRVGKDVSEWFPDNVGLRQC